MQSDGIQINAMRVEAHIGVPDEERVEPQTLTIDLELTPRNSFDELDDDIGRTVDYHAIWTRVRAIAAERPRKLIETLADEIARQLLKDFSELNGLKVRVNKFILPDTDSVSVSVERQR